MLEEKDEKIDIEKKHSKKFFIILFLLIGSLIFASSFIAGYFAKRSADPYTNDGKDINNNVSLIKIGDSDKFISYKLIKKDTSKNYKLNEVKLESYVLSNSEYTYDILTSEININKDTYNSHKGKLYISSEEVVLVNDIKVPSKTFDIKVNEEKALTINVLPINASDKSYTIDIADKDIVSIQNNVVKGLKKGISNIKVTANDGSKTSTDFVINVSNVFHTVSFDSLGGTPVDSLSIEDGKCATSQLSTKEGMKLVGWSTSKEEELPFDFKTPIKNDLTLYAIWKETPKEIKNVTFDYNDGITSSVVVQVKEGDKISKPFDPVRKDYVFKFWSIEGETTEFDFNTPITKDIKLVANWILECETYLSFKECEINGTVGYEVQLLSGATCPKTLIIPDKYKNKNVIKISDEGFKENSDVENVILQDGLLEIGANAFNNCSNLSIISLPNSLQIIGMNALSKTNLKTISLPENVTDIKAGAFSYITSLESFIFNTTKITELKKGFFAGCSSLQYIKLPDEGLTKLSTGTFAQLDSLTSIVIPESVTKIEDMTFVGCNSLTNVKFLGDDPVFNIFTDDGLYKENVHVNDPQENVIQYLTFVGYTLEKSK